MYLTRATRTAFRCALALFLFSALAGATLSVQDFSCNGGQQNIETNVPFNCVATILNDDLQNNAALNTVTLSSLGGWTPATSYSGSFSGNSVPKGSSISVTFANILALSPGTGRTFSDLLINGGSGNAGELADAALNVVAIKTATLTASASTVSYGSEFDATLALDLGGRANVTATATLSGCSLTTGQVAARNLGVVSDTTQSLSWKVAQGSYSGSTCRVSVEISAKADPVTLSQTKTATAAGGGSSGSTTSTTTTSSSAVPAADAQASRAGSGGFGGGGGSGGGKGSTFKILELPKKLRLEPGETSSMKIVISSFYTGFLRNVNITLKGIPKEWYTLQPPKIVSPISNTSFTIGWHVPKEARGTHHVVLEMTGVGTKTAGILKANYEFDLVLPPAEPVRSTQPLQRTGQQATEQQAAGQEKPGTPASTDRTNYPLVAAAVAIALLLMALHHRFGHAITGKTGEGEEKEEEGRQPEEPPEKKAAGKPGKRKKPRAERRK